MSLKRIIKNIYYKIKYHGKHIRLHGCEIGRMDTVFEGYNSINCNSYFYGFLGKGSYIGSDCYIGAKIGKYCSIGDEVRVVNGCHPTSRVVSTSPSFYAKHCQNGLSYVKENTWDGEYRYAERGFGVVVGNDVWIASRVLLIAGIEVGDGAIIASGSVVTKNVPPYCVVGGNPAKIIKKRFSDDQIKILLENPWWDEDDQWFIKNIDYMQDVEDYVSLRESRMEYYDKI